MAHSMARGRWQQVEHVYNAVTSRPEREWAAAVAELCESDAALRNEVESLLAHEGAASAFLETSPLATVDVEVAGTLVGRRFGSYSVLGPLGAGGMGEVYRAHDERLGRDVAIKILPHLFSSDPQRLARFEREARMLAALNHPHIVAIYGREDVDGAPALVLELVEGEMLAELIAQHDGSTGAAAGDRRLGRAKRGLPVHEALTIARQIAEALEAAHERGVVHRDLKPANVKITPGGAVKVLDFGLAKLAAGDDHGSGVLLTNPSTVAAHGTRDGVILGTVAYMSPEQAAGKAADQRSDLWAFGVVVLEMLTGEAVFTGDTESDVLAAVRKTEPDWSRLPADTPAPIRALLCACLEKDPARRLDSAAAARLAIDSALVSPSAEAPERAAVSRRRVGRAGIATAAGVSLLTAGIVWILMQPAPQAPVGSSRFPIVTSPARPINVLSSDRDLALSPDGRHLVYRFAGTETSGSPLMVRAIDELDARPLAGIVNAYAPFFSPDSRWIGFFENAELKKVPTAGGPVEILGPVTGVPLGASWGDDNTIVFATDDPDSGLWRVSADGGEPSMLTRPNTAQREHDHVFPSVLPNAGAVLFTITEAGESANAQLAALDLGTGQRNTLVAGATQAEYVGRSARFAQGGFLTYVAAGALRAVRFDPVGLALLGDAVTLEEHVMLKPSGAANYAVSRQGTMAYVPLGAAGTETPRRSLVWVDRKGSEEPIDAPLLAYGPPRISPDGTRVVVPVNDRGNTDIYVLDLAGGTPLRLTDAPGVDGLPLWTPDSRQIIFMSERARAGIPHLYMMAADGSGPVDPITASMNKQWPTSIITHEGGFLLFGFDRGPAIARRVIGVHLPNRITHSMKGPDPSGTTSRDAESSPSAGMFQRQACSSRPSFTENSLRSRRTVGISRTGPMKAEGMRST